MAQTNVKAVITAEDRASHVIAGVGSSFGKMAGAMAVGQLAATALHKAFSLVTDNIGSAIKRVDTLNNSSRVFENMGFKAADTAKAMKALEASINGLPTPLDAAVRNMQLIAASTGDISKSQQIFSAMNDAIIGFGGSTDMVNNAMIQLSQAFSAGRIDAQTWNSMMQSGLGPTLNAIAKQMGITTGQLKEGLSNGKISVKEFQDRLIELDTKGGGGLASLHKIAKDATGGIGTSIENMKTAITRGLGEIIKAFGGGDISKAITNFGTGVERALTNIANFMNSSAFKNALQDFKQWFGDVLDSASKIGRAIADYLGPKFEALGNTLKDAMPTLERLWREILAPLAKLLGVELVLRIGLAIDAFNLFVKILTPIIDILTNFIHYLTSTLPQQIETAFNWIVGKIIWMKDNFWSVIGEIIGFFVLLPIKLPILMLEALIAVVRIVVGINWASVFSGIWQGMQQVWDKIINIVKSSWHTIASIDWGGLFTGIGKSFANGMIALIEGALKGALKGLPGNLENKIHLPRFDSGGIVPGPTGQAQLAIVHGGETILPTHKRGYQGGVTLNVNVGVYAGTEVEKRKLAQELLNAYQDALSMRGI